jgi:hypothetical protein
LVGGGKKEEDKGRGFEEGKKVEIENAVNIDRKLVLATVHDNSRRSGSHRVFLLRSLNALYKFGYNVSIARTKLGQIKEEVGDTV